MAPADQLLQTRCRQVAAHPWGLLALGLLLAMNLFDYIDRQVLAAVEPEIRKSFFSQDPRRAAGADGMGFLASAFLVSYMLTAPLFGALA